MENEGLPFNEVLADAQKLGYAEADPSLDIDGWDSLFKLIIITVHAFGLYVAPEKIFTYGISNMNDDDIRFATEKERRFKLVAHVEKLEGNRLIMSVMPQLISRNKYIYSVEDEFNGVVIKGLFYDKQFMFGRGAGGYPTGSAVLSDITACLYNYKYEYKKRNDSQLPTYTTDHSFRVYYRYTDAEDLALLHFDSVSENYISDSYKYVVGCISLAELHKVQEELRGRNIFIAAYPRD
jgi:homoserine dehydrogenase